MKGNKNNKFKRIIISIAVFAMIFISAQASTANNQLDNTNEMAIGFSGGEKPYDLDITTEGSLTDGNLKLVLSSSDLYSIKMIAPKGEPQLRHVKPTIPLGSSNEEEQEQEKIDKSVFSSASIATLGISSEDEDIAETKFDAPVAGKYEFQLYDAENNLVGKEYYEVFAGSGTLQINFNDGKTNFDFHNTAGLNLSYSTNNLEKEKITLYLPPGYTFVSKPITNAQYVVKDIVNAPLPEEFYTDPSADILKDPAYANLTKVQGIELALNQGGTQSLLFSFSIKFNNSTAILNNLATLMIAYGENPDAIPLNIGAKATSVSGDVTHDIAVLEGVSDVVRGSGRSESKLIYPHLTGGYNPKLSINRVNPYFWEGVVRVFEITWPHYPISNLKAYTSVPVGTDPPSGNTVEVVDGKTYYISDYSKNTNLLHFGGGQVADARNTSSTSATHEALVPGHVYVMEPGFVTYTYKGEEHKDFYMPKTDVTVPQYLTTVPGRISWSYPTRVEQGSDIGIEFNFANINANLLTPVYEEAKVTVEVPYGIRITSTTHTLNSNNTQVPLNHVEYYVDGDPVARTAIIGNGWNIVYNFPLAAGERISKLIYHYDKWTAFSTYVMKLNGVTMTHEPDGITLLPEEYPVQIKANLQVKDNVAIEMSGTDSPVSVPKTMPSFTKDHVLYRVPPVLPKDGLRFGSRSGYVDRTLTNYSQTETLTSTHMFLKSVADATKDYENVQITVKPSTTADEAIFSWMTGIRTSNFGPKGYSEKRDVYYKTSEDASWRLASTVSPNAADTRHLFTLEEGEFVTEIRIDAGTIYGSKFSQSGTGGDNANASGQGHGVMSWGNTNMFIEPVVSQSYRNYFPGDPVREKLALTGDKWYFETFISTDSEAQYINPGPGANPSYNTNKTRSSLTLSTTWNYHLSRNAITNPAFFPNNRIYYQGETFVIRFTNEASTPNADQGTQYEHYVNFYVSVHKYFDVLSLTGGFQFQSVKDIPGSDYKLYTYTGKTNDANNTLRTDITLYVRPDSVAPTAAVTPINNAGVSHDDFANRYIVPGHENFPPYAVMNFINMRPFPATWGITDNIQYLLNGAASVKLEMQLMDKIELLASNQGAIVKDMLTVYDHQKDSVDVHAFFANLSSQPLEEYEIELIIPKKDRDTLSGEDPSSPTPENKPNDIDFHISGPVVFQDAPVGTTYLYYDLGDNVIDIGTATADQKKSIARVVINIKQFPPESNLGIVLPLYTEHEKLGMDIEDLYGYVGANRRMKALATSPWDNKVYTKAFPIQLSSYPLEINIGLDVNEVGQWTNNLPSAIDTKVYFTGSSGEELLYSGDITKHTLKINKDASHITVAPKNPEHYMLTLPNYSANLSKNSNFPRTGRLDININDLIQLKPNVHDAAFIIKPTLPIKDFIAVNSLAVPKGASVSQLVDFRFSTNNGIVPARAYYTQSVTNVGNPTFVDLSINSSNKNIVAFGKEVGETTFDYTLTNRLGDAFKVDGVKVNVVKNYVPRAIIRKGFTGSDQNLDTDLFYFLIWNAGTIALPENTNYVVNVNENTDTNIPSFIERGVKHYIKEDAKLGYENDGYSGTVDGVPLAFKDEGGGVFSFTPPIDAIDLQIKPYNKNTKTDLTIRKSMDAAAVGHNPNQKFVITVTEKGEATPVVTATLGNGESLAVNQLTFGRTYVIEETPVADYLLAKVTVEKAGTTIGEQPTKPIPTDDNVYEFKLGVNHIGGEIVVYNQLARGKGIQLSKAVTLDNSLPVEDFTFKLAGATDTFYGKVDKAITVFPANVKWYDNAGFTGTEVDVSELKPGTYTLTEDAGTNYDLEKLQVTGGTASVGTTDKTLIFEVTPTSELMIVTANNSVKKAGWVSVTKVVDPSYLSDTMAFTLTNVATGKQYISQAVVTANNFIFSSWKLNGSLVSTMELPYGQYTLTETLEGDHYRFKEFDITGTPGITIDQTKKIATFTLSNTAPTINAKAVNELFERGELKINHVPNVDYGSIPIGSVIDVVKLTSNVYVEVENTLRLPATWSLTARSDSQTAIISGNTVTLPYQALQHSKDGVVFKSLSTQQTIMDQSEPKVGNLHKLDWTTSDTKGVTANVWFHPNTQAGAYSSTITWSLQRTP